jgi:DNA replication licensing factor MCM7
MKESERASIHEAMEQQTLSFAKAGITTTLNARVSILAAANPVYGRYNNQLSPSENIGLSASLLSRFDLLWLVLDRPDEDKDIRLAKHIIHVHIHKQAPPAKPKKLELLPPCQLKTSLSLSDKEIGTNVVEYFCDHFPINTIRSYLTFTQKFTPYIPEELTEWLAMLFMEIRKEESVSNQIHSYTTARSLISVLRMSQALSKANARYCVTSYDVEESLRLIDKSKESIDTIDNCRHRRNDQNELSEIINKIRVMIFDPSSWGDNIKSYKITFDFIYQQLHGIHTEVRIHSAMLYLKKMGIPDIMIDNNFNIILRSDQLLSE